MEKKKCLKCDKEFNSDGAFNRLCPTCRKVNSRTAPEVSWTGHRTSRAKQRIGRP